MTQPDPVLLPLLRCFGELLLACAAWCWFAWFLATGHFRKDGREFRKAVGIKGPLLIAGYVLGRTTGLVVPPDTILKVKEEQSLDLYLGKQ